MIVSTDLSKQVSSEFDLNKIRQSGINFRGDNIISIKFFVTMSVTMFGTQTPNSS